MTTFNATSGHNDPPPSTGLAPAESAPVLDTLAMVRQATANQVPIEPEVVYAPGDVGIRLVCLPDIASKSLQRWQQQALPKHLRNSPNVSPLSMDQLLLSVATLVNTLIRLEVRDAHDRDLWHTVCDPIDQRPLGFNDTALLQSFGAMDAPTALKKIFGRESDIVQAGRQVMGQSGWGDKMVTDADVDSDENPT